MREIYSNKPKTAKPVPIYLGGTGAEIESDAANNLGLLKKTDVGVANGAVGIDANGLILAANTPTSTDLRTVNLDGVDAVGVSSTNYFTITDVSMSRTYTVSATLGTAWVLDDKVVYVAPAVAGAEVLTLNGRSFSFSVVTTKPNRPEIRTPVNTATVANATAGDTTTFVIATDFSTIGTTDTHLNTDWQLSLVSDFSTLYAQSLADATNKTVWPCPTLTAGTTFYVRARYRSSGGVVSDWSRTVCFASRTSLASSPLIETKIPRPLTGENAAGGDVRIKLTEDGTRLFLGLYFSASGNTGYAGSVFVYARTNDTWALEASLVHPYPAENAYFGLGLDADATGTRLFVGAVTASGTPRSGAVYVYLRTGTTWAREATLKSSDIQTWDWFGANVACDSTGTRLLVSSQNNTVTGAPGPNTGKAYIFTRTGTTWAQEAGLVPTTIYAGSSFGKDAAMTRDGTRAFLCCGNDTVSSSKTSTVYVFTRSGTTWTQETRLYPASFKPNGVFGAVLHTTASRVYIAACDEDVGEYTAAGAVYIYSRSGTTWTQEAKLVSPEPCTMEQFGRSLAVCEGLSNNRLYVGAIGMATQYPNACGKVFAFTRSGTTWSHEFTYTPPDAAFGDRFGGALSAAYLGTRVAVYSTMAAGIYAAQGGLYVIK